MKFKTLDKVQVGGHWHSIELKDSYSVDGDGQNKGESGHEEKSIVVSFRTCDGGFRPLSGTEESLLHELIHAASYTFRAQLSEDQTTALSEGLYQILKQYGLVLIKDD